MCGKSPSPVFSQIKILSHICLEHIRAGVFWLVNGAWSVQISLLINTRPLFHWRKSYYGLYFCRKQWFEVKNIVMMNLFLLVLKTLTDGLEWCGLLWCFYQLFGLSFWRHPFTAEDPSDAMLHFSKSDEETKLISLIQLLKVEDLSLLSVWMSIS